MQEPLFKNKRTYFVVAIFFGLLAFVVLRDGFGKIAKRTPLVQSPQVTHEEVNESESDDYKIGEGETSKTFEGGGIKLAVPKLWGIGMILYRPSEPNIILAMSNSVDLGGGTEIPAGVVRGKLQLSTRVYAVEFSQVSNGEFGNPKSSFWTDRKKAFETNPTVKVDIKKVEFSGKDYMMEEMKVVNTKENIDATSIVYYRLIGEDKIVAVSWSFENKISDDLEKSIGQVMSSLEI